jgi:hypothetical protein
MEQPLPRFHTPSSTIVFLFGIPWTIFSAGWMALTIGGAAWSISHSQQAMGWILVFFALFGLPFLLVGFGMLAAPLWARHRALKTVYVITDQRAITFDGGWTTTIRSYSPERLQNIYRRERGDGTGDVIFSHRVWRDSEGGQQVQNLGFLNIREAKRVEQMLRELAKQHS